MHNGISKFSLFFVFCKLASQAPNVTDPLPLPLRKKLTGFASTSGTTCGKSGVDMFTAVNPVATPLAIEYT